MNLNIEEVPIKPHKQMQMSLLPSKFNFFNKNN